MEAAELGLFMLSATAVTALLEHPGSPLRQTLPDAFEAAIRDVERFSKSWPRALRALITGRFPVERYRDLLLGRPSGIKNVITFAG